MLAELKNYIPPVLVVALLSTTLIVSFQSVDYVKPDVFFYLRNLPYLYFLSLFASIGIAVFGRNDVTRLIGAISLGLLIVWTPDVMLRQSWFIDTYSFVAEPLYVARNGYLANFHYLQESPAPGLFFGPFLLMTGLPPLGLIKIYEAFLITMLVLMFYMIGKRLKIGPQAAILAPLLFVSMAWTADFQFGRASFSLIYYVGSWLLISLLMFREEKRKIFALLVLSVFVLALSHPITPLYFAINLLAVLAINVVFRRLRTTEVRSIAVVSLISTFLWAWWNFTLGNRVLRDLSDMIVSFLNALLENPSKVPGIARIFAEYTPNYGFLIDVRFALTLAVFGGAFVIPFILYKYSKEDRAVTIILMGWALSNMATSVPLLYFGLPHFGKPVIFTLTSWCLLGAFASWILIGKGKHVPHVRARLILQNAFLLGFIVLPSVLIPLIKYAPLPFLYCTSKELASRSFLDLRRGNETFPLVSLEFNLPYLYSYVVYGYTGPESSTDSLLMSNAYIQGKGLNATIISDALVWITYRLMTRDAFWVYRPSLSSVVENASDTLPNVSHNKIYDSGWPDSIFLPR